jgi:hypothetical protein
MGASINTSANQMQGYMDARATQHMTPQRNWFHGYISFVTLEMMYLTTIHLIKLKDMNM